MYKNYITSLNAPFLLFAISYFFITSLTFSIIFIISSLFVFILALFTIILALISHISSTTTKPFSLKVFPVSTISTMASASPTIGPNSTDPLFQLIPHLCLFF